VEYAVRFVPVLENAMLVEQRAAVLGYPPAGRMVMGPVPEWKNVYIAMVGDGGTGLSPVVGRIMTDLIVGGDRARKAIEEVKSISPAKFVS
jgi:glycine/D-amino acid oxidase-like deaminating enzyme